MLEVRLEGEHGRAMIGMWGLRDSIRAYSMGDGVVVSNNTRAV